MNLYLFHFKSFRFILQGKENAKFEFLFDFGLNSFKINFLIKCRHLKVFPAKESADDHLRHQNHLMIVFNE